MKLVIREGNLQCKIAMTIHTKIPIYTTKNKTKLKPCKESYEELEY